MSVYTVQICVTIIIEEAVNGEGRGRAESSIDAGLVGKVLKKEARTETYTPFQKFVVCVCLYMHFLYLLHTLANISFVKMGPL